jgi:hypothetical protein
VKLLILGIIAVIFTVKKDPLAYFVFTSSNNNEIRDFTQLAYTSPVMY